MLNEKSKKKKSEAIDPYLKQNYFDVDNGDNKILNYQDEDRFEYPDYVIDSLRNKRQIDITPLQEGERKYESYLTPLYGITAFFAAVFIIGPFLVKKGPNRGIVQASIMLTAFCMWIFWFTIYFGQMNPLMGPRLENTTVAWIAYKLGNPIPAPPPEESPEGSGSEHSPPSDDSPPPADDSPPAEEPVTPMRPPTPAPPDDDDPSLSRH